MGRKLRVALVPVGMMLLFVWLIPNMPRVDSSQAALSFLLGLATGALLGIGIAVLPLLAGAAQAKVAGRTQWWIAVALMALVLLLQFLMHAYGLRVSWLNFLRVSRETVLLAEGAVLAFSTVQAVKAKK